MYAKSVSEFSRSSRIINNDDSKSYQASPLSKSAKITSSDREVIEKYDKLMELTKESIDGLFLDDETKREVYDVYNICYKSGFELSKLGPKRFTEANNSAFFSNWNNLVNILDHYFSFNPVERYTQYIDEKILKTIKIIEPLKKYKFKNAFPEEGEKLEKKAKLYQNKFDTTISEISKQNCKFFSGKISLDEVSQSLKSLISSISSYDNVFFHQSREDAVEILYKTQTNLNQILDAFLDYSSDEKSAVNCDLQFANVTKKLRKLFVSKNSESQPIFSSISIVRDKSTSENANVAAKDQNSSDKTASSVKQVAKKRSIRKKETEEDLQNEIDELNQSIQIINQKISDYQSKKPSKPKIYVDRNTQYQSLDILSRISYLSELIKFNKEFNSQVSKDLKSFQMLNSKFDDKSKRKIERQSIFSSSTSVKGEMINLKDELAEYADELAKYQKQDAKAVNAKKVKNEDLMRLILELQVQKKGLEEYCDDVSHQVAEIENYVDSYIQPLDDKSLKARILIDMINFIDSRKNEINEIKAQIKKVPKEPEVYQSSKNGDYSDTKEKMENARKELDENLSILENLVNEELLPLEESVNKKNYDLFKTKLSNAKEGDFLMVSQDCLQRLDEEMDIKYTIKSRMNMISQWIDKNCPDYAKLDIPLNEKLKKLMRDCMERRK